MDYQRILKRPYSTRDEENDKQNNDSDNYPLRKKRHNVMMNSPPISSSLPSPPSSPLLFSDDSLSPPDTYLALIDTEESINKYILTCTQPNSTKVMSSIITSNNNSSTNPYTSVKTTTDSYSTTTTSTNVSTSTVSSRLNTSTVSSSTRLSSSTVSSRLSSPTVSSRLSTSTVSSRLSTSTVCSRLSTSTVSSRLSTSTVSSRLSTSTVSSRLSKDICTTTTSTVTVRSTGANKTFNKASDKCTSGTSRDTSITCTTIKSDGIASNSHDKTLAYNTDVVTNFIRPNQDLNVVYYPHFLSSQDSRLILKTLKDQLEPYFQQSPNIVRIYGREIPIPRRQTAFGDGGLKYSFSGVSLPSNPWIPIINQLKKCVEDASGETFNFVLVNSYADGNKYIGEHRDDEKELRPCSTIASLTFGAQRDFVFRHSASRGKPATRKDIEPVKICLLNGSLLLMKHPTNKTWYHSLPVRKGVDSLRINLTFRQMIKQ